MKKSAMCDKFNGCPSGGYQFTIKEAEGAECNVPEEGKPVKIKGNTLWI